MLRFEKLATPPATATVVVPDSVPPPALVPIATVTLPAKLVTLFASASCAVSCTAGLIVRPATALLGCTVNTNCVAGPAVIAKVRLLAPGSRVAAAVSRYPVPLLSMLRLEKVATPFTAATTVVPESVPPTGLVPIATVTVPVKLATRFPNASSALTTTAGVMTAPATVLLGCPVNASWPTAPAVTVTAAVCVTVTPAIAAVTVFSPATVELTLPAAIPFTSVGPAGCTSVFPLPVAASTTAAPLIGLPKASRAATVSVAWLVPVDAVIDVGEATSVDTVADTTPGVMLNGALVATGSPVAVAVSV